MATVMYNMDRPNKDDYLGDALFCNKQPGDIIKIGHSLCLVVVLEYELNQGKIKTLGNIIFDSFAKGSLINKDLNPYPIVGKMSEETQSIIRKWLVRA